MVAVSGGVDSVALLHMLRDKAGVQLVVAHFDHGIRNDSAADRLFVQTLADDYGLPFVYQEGRLGAGASEATARQARYEFLEAVRRDQAASAILTAHHQDDVLETAIINMLRGGGRKGLTALANRPGVERPLLKVPKPALIAYAKDQGLNWREDVTNQDQAYLRNYVRHSILPRFDEPSRARLIEIIKNQQATNEELDDLLAGQLSERSSQTGLDRQWFAALPHQVAMETMAAWLRLNAIRDFDSKALERLVVASKVAQPGTSFDVLGGVQLNISSDGLALSDKER